MRKPNFDPMQVPAEIYDAVCEAVTQEFADSYLTGASYADRKLTPRTLTAWERMKDNFAFRKLLQQVRIELVRPLRIQEQEAPITHEFIYRVRS